MWLVPFSPGLDHVVTICFDRAESIAGLRFWNYNKSPEDTYRGVSRDGGAVPSPMAGKRGHDEWSAWLPERSINPPELSKWSWGLQPGTEHAAVFFLCKQQMQACKEPRQLGKLQQLVSSRGSGPSADWAPTFSVGCGPVVLRVLPGARHFSGPSCQPLGGRCYPPPSFRVSISEVQKEPVTPPGSTARAPVHICLAWGPHSKLCTTVRVLGGKARRPPLGSGHRHQKCPLA